MTEEKTLDPRDKTIEVLIRLLMEYAELNQTLLGLLTPEGKTVLKRLGSIEIPPPKQGLYR